MGIECGQKYTALRLSDRGLKGVLEDQQDQITINTCVTDCSGTIVGESPVSVETKDFFKASYDHDISPMDRLNEVLNVNPQLRAVSSALMKYIVTEQQLWAKQTIQEEVCDPTNYRPQDI